MDPFQLGGAKGLGGGEALREIPVETGEKLGGRSVLDRPEGGHDARYSRGKECPGDADAPLAGALASARRAAGGARITGSDQRRVHAAIRNDRVADEVDHVRLGGARLEGRDVASLRRAL